MRFEKFETVKEQNRQTSARDVVALLFRHERFVVTIFIAILAATVLYGCFATRMYESSLTVLVNHGRQDPLVSADRHDTVAPAAADVTEEELYSEVEIFKSRESLKQAVIQTGLYSPKLYGPMARFSLVAKNSATPENADKDPRVVGAIRKLDAALKVQPIKKTNLIQVTYQSPDPELAARVLNTLSNLYLQKHLSVRTPKGTYELFQKQSENYRAQLQSAEEELKNFVKKTGIQNSSSDDQIVVSKMAEFQASLRQSTVALHEARERERELLAALTTAPDRYQTQVRTDPTLLQNLKQNLLSLELKRSQMAVNFQPSYRPLQELESEIEQTKHAIQEAETHPLAEETTDQEPTQLWLRSELVKTRADIASLQARQSASQAGYQEYVQQVANLGQQGLVQTDLLRRVKIAEDNYLLYTQKQEEARITEVLNLQHILNVSIVDPASVPIAPSAPLWSYVLLLGGVIAVALSVGTAFAIDYADPTLRTPDEVEKILEVPIWGAVPAGRRSIKAGISVH